MIISIEGLDGVGKSCLAIDLSKSLDIEIIEKPIKRLLNLSKEQSKQITCNIYEKYSTNIQAMYYLMGYLSALEDGQKKDYILDRSTLSTYYFSYCDENSKLFDFFASNYGFPDLTIILYASIEERIKRITTRNNNDSDLKRDRIYKDGYKKYFEAIRKYNVPYLIINTEKLNQKEVLDLSINLIELWKKDTGSQELLKNIFNIDNLEQLSKLGYEEMLGLITNQQKRLTLERRNNNA